VVLATGYENVPLVPDWDCREGFAGELIHSAEYRNADRFRSKRVLVVGPGCSGMEIAHDVARGGAAKVRLAVRTPPTIISRAGPGGLPGEWVGTALLYFPTRFGNAFARFGSRQDFGDLSEYGLPVPEEGLMTRFRRDGAVPSIVDKEVIEAVKEGRVEIVGAVESLDSAAVILAGGSRVEPNAIICATGYRRAPRRWSATSVSWTIAGGQPSRRRNPRLPACASSASQAARARSASCPGRRSGPPRRSPAR
jgi:cation diffusion facilitator CzcD-associated flavoprotein CzcO